MALKNLIVCFIALTSAIAASTAGGTNTHSTGEAWLAGCQVDDATAVRFFYDPEWADYYHFPLIFRVVAGRDPRLNTAPMQRQGRTAYITDAEMKAMLRALAQSGASWSVSSTVEPPGDYHRLVPHADLRIRVVCSSGTAQAKVEPSKVCGTLAPLDSVLKTPRALWEFQALRIGYKCKVPGFNWDAYPKRRP